MKILITAGPTREAIDPVRFLSNRSSGKMGYAIAGAAAHAGHRVLLISGPTALDIPEHVDFIPVESAAEMFEAVGASLPGMDVAIFAAAVADFTPASVGPHKMKKAVASLSLDLVRTKDILGTARGGFGFGGCLVGFAAETGNLERNGRRKLAAKGCDLVVANDVSRSDIGFDSHENEALLIFRDRTEIFKKGPKHELASLIVELAEEILRQRRSRLDSEGDRVEYPG